MRDESRPPADRQITSDDDAYGGLGAPAWELLAAPGGNTLHDEPPHALEPAVAVGSFVVDPPFFGDGDIGRLAVCGVLNDLAARGVEPRWATLSFTVEAGLPVPQLRRVLASAREAADEAGVRVRGLETRVVRAGDANRLFAHATAMGPRCDPAPLRADVVPGDLLMLTSRLGGWAVHVLSVREGLGLENLVASGCRPLNAMLRDAFRAAGPGAIRRVHRIASGGLAAVLQNQAVAAGFTIRVRQDAVPIQHEVSSAADLLGIDPFLTTDEGCLCLCVAAEAAEKVRAALRAHPYGRHAAVIGEVTGAAAPVALIADTTGKAWSPDSRAAFWPTPSRLR